MPDAYMQLKDGDVIATSTPEYWPEAKRLSKAKGKAAMKERGRERLLEILKPGDTVHCVLRHVSRSGMRRRIDFYKLVDGDQLYLTQSIAWLLDYPCDGNSGLVVDGCGMDMGFSVVYNTSSALFPKGFGCIGEKCPSNDHSNGDRDYTPHRKTKPHWHESGGYALKHRWL